MGDSQLDRLKSLAWEAGVKGRHPRRTLNEAAKGVVFDAVGTEIFEETWDLLVVLDACRPDALRSVSDEFEFVEDVQVAYSKGSSSQQWIRTNFGPRHRDRVSRTAYVTGNPFSESLLDERDFGTLDEVWRYAWDEQSGTVPPRPITDRAIQVGRESNPDRLVVHYMQPHFPSLADPELGSEIDPDGNVWINSVWDRLESGDVDRETVWEAYVENLRIVLEDVETLLENVDADTAVLTADHGNGFGEADVYGHPRTRVHRSLRAVPWMVTSGRDSGTYEPKRESPKREAPDDAVQDRLQSLGYH